MEETQDNVMNEVVPPEQVNQEANLEQNEVVNDSQESRQPNNFRRMREKQDALERELRMQREMNDKLLQMATQSFPKQQEVPDELDSLGDEEFIPKGKIKQMVAREKDKIIKEAMQEVDKHLAKRDQGQFLDKLKRTYSDFDQVVNQETLAILEEQEPELAKTISEISDPYKAYLSCYKYIKATNLVDKAPQSRRENEINKKLDKNSKTVQSPQAFDKRPMAEAFRMTDAMKSELHNEMMQYAGQAGFAY